MTLVWLLHFQCKTLLIDLLDATIYFDKYRVASIVYLRIYNHDENSGFEGSGAILWKDVGQKKVDQARAINLYFLLILHVIRKVSVATTLYTSVGRTKQRRRKKNFSNHGFGR